MANPTPGIFSLKIFKENTIFPSVKNIAVHANAVPVPLNNELNTLEYRKFMDNEGLTKKLNEYKKVMLLLGGKVDKAADAAGEKGYLKDDGSDEGFPKQSAELYIDANKIVLDSGDDYIKRISDLTSDGLTINEARKIAADETKGILNSKLRILDEEKPLSLFMQHAKANFETKMKMHRKKKEINPFL